jgi:NAD(P)-dependent dehydrogenase (short-subunit alcohol dehydrogenase family)
VLPAMRRQGWGRIVNLSSMGGRLTFPGGGAYHATKHAVEALSDALRFEVRGFGVDVVIVEPGLIRTNFGEAAVQAIAEGAEGDGPYREFNRAVAESTARVYESGPLSRLGGPPEAVARTIERALVAERPRARYTVTPSAKLLIAQHAVLPDAAWDAMLRAQFPQPGTG